MAPKRLDEGYTEFGGATNRFGSWWYPFGRLGRFFSKFFTREGQKGVAREFYGRGEDHPSYPGDPFKPNGPMPDNNPPPPSPLAGDTVVKADVIKAGTIFSYQRGDYPIVPEQELDRKRRYKEYENMDEYPEVGAAFDIYADDSTQTTLEGERWNIVSEDKLVIEEIKSLFNTIHLDRFLWDIIRNTVKYGDCFIEIIPDLKNVKRGIQRIKILNPNWILRVENEYGYLESFLQEIPQKDEWDAFGDVAGFMRNRKVIPLDKNQIIHFRLYNSDPSFYPYGKSIAALARQVYRSLKLMEDAMLIYRLSRAPERRIFYMDTGSLPASKAEMFLERQKAKFKKEKYYDSSNDLIDSRYNPMSSDEDFFIAVNGNRSGTKIETLPGAQNLGEVDDVKYFRDKLLATLKIPKDYIVEFDKSPERKANLSQLDVKFARVIDRIQKNIEVGLETIAKRHLLLKGFPYQTVSSIKIKLPEPSDMAAKRQLDIDEQKARVVQAVKGLGIFPIEKIYKDYYGLTDSEIDELKDSLKKEQKDPVLGAMGMGAMGMPGAPGMAPPGGPMGGPPMEEAPPGEAGNQESDENIPPTSNESVDLEELRDLLLERNSGEAAEIISEMIVKKKLTQKDDN